MRGHARHPAHCRHNLVPSSCSIILFHGEQAAFGARDGSVHCDAVDHEHDSAPAEVCRRARGAVQARPDLCVQNEQAPVAAALAGWSCCWCAPVAPRPTDRMIGGLALGARWASWKWMRDGVVALRADAPPDLGEAMMEEVVAPKSCPMHTHHTWMGWQSSRLARGL